MSETLTRCSVCRALIDEEDLFCANCGTEAPLRDDAASTPARADTYRFSCDSCGASMSYDASEGTLRCPFCGSLRMSEQQDAKTLRPNKVVPFALDHATAVGHMRRHISQGFWRPGDLSEKALVVSMTPVYVPYWVFRARTHTYWAADTSITPAGARGDWFPLWGEHRGSYTGLLVGASGALTPAETSNLCPFDLAAGVPPEQVDLDNATCESFSVPRKYARPLARQGFEYLEAQECTARYVSGRCRNMKVNMLVDGMSSEPVLLPVWIMAYRYREQVFRFLVNGQNGRCTGGAPTSYRKIAAAVGIGLAILLLIVLLIVGGAAIARRATRDMMPGTTSRAQSAQAPASRRADRQNNGGQKDEQAEQRPTGGRLPASMGPAEHSPQHYLSAHLSVLRNSQRSRAGIDKRMIDRKMDDRKIKNGGARTSI